MHDLEAQVAALTTRIEELETEMGSKDDWTQEAFNSLAFCLGQVAASGHSQTGVLSVSPIGTRTATRINEIHAAFIDGQNSA